MDEKKRKCSCCGKNVSESGFFTQPAEAKIFCVECWEREHGRHEVSVAKSVGVRR